MPRGSRPPIPASRRRARFASRCRPRRSAPRASRHSRYAAPRAPPLAGSPVRPPVSDRSRGSDVRRFPRRADSHPSRSGDPRSRRWRGRRYRPTIDPPGWIWAPPRWRRRRGRAGRKKRATVSRSDHPVSISGAECAVLGLTCLHRLYIVPNMMRCAMKSAAFALLAMVGLPASAAEAPARPLIAPAAAPKPVNVIFDTDMWGDIDDVLALAMLHTLQDRGEAKLLAVTSSTDDPSTVRFIDARGA